MFGQLYFIIFLGYHILIRCTASIETVRQKEQGDGSEAVKRVLQSQDLNAGRLSSCNRGTVSGLTFNHWKLLEQKYKEFGCWKSKVTKLFALLYKEEKLGQHFEYPSGSQGYRLRCRLLFKFDLCRSNFIRVRSAYHPDVSVNWPEAVSNVIRDHSLMDDGEDYGDDYYYSYNNMNGQSSNNIVNYEN